MKLLLLLLSLVCLGSEARAQTQSLSPPLPGLPFDSLTHLPNYHGIVAAPGLSAAELQGRAREWVALTFQDAHQVTQFDDPARGVLIGRGYTRVVAHYDESQSISVYYISFTFRLDFKEGRYHYELRDLGFLSGTGVSLAGTATISDTNSLLAAQFERETAATSTLASSSRQQLLTINTPANRVDIKFNGKPNKAWPYLSADFNKALYKLLDTLAQHATAPASKW